MYPVSDAFLEAVKQPVIDYTVSGSIGNISFDESNIKEDSFRISNQSTDTDDVVLGSVQVGQLEATFIGLNINYTDWVGKVIIPMISLRIGANSTEGFLMGKFTVAEAKHSAEGVQVVAYDNMMKFDRKFKKSHFRSAGTPISYAQQACIDCGMIFANTQAEIETFANYDETVAIFGVSGKYKKFKNDIDTYRDLIYWCAQTLGCFATINRDGNLVFRKYTNVVVDEITESHRLTGATFEDYITNYTGIYVANMRYGTESYYGYDTAALTAEIAAVTAEKTQVETDIMNNILALAELERKHEAHEITDEEYRTQKAALDNERKELDTQKKQLEKRLNWLNKALAKAQAGEDGSYMDLGENPLLQSNIYSHRERQRRAVLSSLDMISYTPFNCCTVFGAHYDLGDVIYFSGGHTGSDGVFCCVMGYEFALNGEYTMQGFGVNPSLEATQTKAQKTAKMANSNAVSAKEITSGDTTPSVDEGLQDNVYVQYNERTVYTAKYPIEYHGWADEVRMNGQSRYTFTRPDDMLRLTEFTYDETTGYYGFKASGKVYNHIVSNENPNAWSTAEFGTPVFEIHFDPNPNPQGDTYKISCDAKWTLDTPTQQFEYGTGCGMSKIATNDYIYYDRPPYTDPPDFKKIFDTRNDWKHYEWTVDSVRPEAVANPLYIWYEAVFTEEDIGSNGAYHEIEVKNWRVEKLVGGQPDGGVDVNEEKYIEKMYIKDEEDEEETGIWREIKFLADVDDSEFSGLEQNYKHVVSLTPEVMRAWFKADPPQIKRDFNQFCIRYTGDPDNNVTITFDNAVGWSARGIKHDSEGVYSIKNGGSYESGTVQYIAYRLDGLVSGQKYYFNFAANFTGATFGDDFTKGLGLVFSNSNSINTDNWTGDPHTFNSETKYASFFRTNNKKYYAFSFAATASTMYMILTTGDITGGSSIKLELSSFVLAKQERKYARNLYVFDTKTETWVSYKPFGSKGDGETVISELEDLDDVDIESITDGQALIWDEATGKWVNGDIITSYQSLTDKPSVNDVVLYGNKTSRDLGIMQELTQAQYDALSAAEKNDPDKIYLIKDAGGSGGGGGGGGGNYTETLLWDYEEDNNGTIPYAAFSVTLRQSIDNFDEIMIENVSRNSDLTDQNWRSTNFFSVKVNALKNAYVPYYFAYTSYDNRSSRYHVEGTTFEKTINNTNNTNGLVKVYGIKY